jgi:hypothetical protein
LIFLLVALLRAARLGESEQKKVASRRAAPGTNASFS